MTALAAKPATRPVMSHSEPVAQLLGDPSFEERLRQLADQLNRDPASVRAEATAYLREMSATHGERAMAAWRGFGRWMLRAHEVVVSQDQIARLRKLDGKHPLLVLPSHRSYLDGWVMPEAFAAHGISPMYVFGGANINFFPFGAFARRTGMVFVRRATAELPVYRFALRAYIGQLVRDRRNLYWSIEGGRTRTGKLRPPMYGILRYVLEAVEAVEGPEALVVPASLQYDQLHEVSLMTAEAHGGAKRPENVAWLVRLARQQGRPLGRVYLDFGEPVPLRAQLAELRAGEAARGHEVERIALDISHRINRTTPVTATAVVSLALLGADRALTLDEVLATVRPLASYIQRRRWPVAGAADLTDRVTIERALQELVASGVLSGYDGGTQAVWDIASGQHLVAAFYRNSAIHILVDRAIAELALQAAAEGKGDIRKTVVAEALRLREILKFEFFFSAREAFAKELIAELLLLGANIESAKQRAVPADAERLLRQADLLLAHLVLRPYLDAYRVVADRLATLGYGTCDEPRFLAECLRVGKQWELQRRIASAESVSLELFRTALRLARHRELVDGTGPDLAARRRAFAEEIARAADRASRIAALAGSAP